jgi:biotin-(acetyl-CoA carboxylase) ligase
VEVTSPTERLNGLALDVDHDGALTIRLKDERIRRVFVGDVSLQTSKE